MCPASDERPAQPRLVPIAPAVNQPTTTQQQQENPPELMPSTCITCARRKVKCDKTNPCGACRKGKLQCTFQDAAPRKRKRKPAEDIQDRLDRYERLLKANNLLPVSESDQGPRSRTEGTVRSESPPSPAPATFASTPKTGTLLAGRGKTRFVGSNFWAHLGDELNPSSDEEENDYDSDDHTQSRHEPNDPVSTSFMGSTPTTSSLLAYHPTYDGAISLWRLYVRNVEPLIKCVHIPSGLMMVQRAASNPSSMSKVTECLLFAIYHLSVISATPQECIDLFGQSRSVLTRLYYDATRQALVNCSFLKTTEFNVLQAFTLFLISVRTKYDLHTFWILTGVAVRIAQRMGLHRDGEDLGLNPFDVHLRRRLFWIIILLDGFAGQLCGTGIAIAPESWDTRMPLNINDEDVWPDMEEKPQERRGATEMIFSLARTEISNFLQRQTSTYGFWARNWGPADIPLVEKTLQELECTLEEKYIRYCDISEPTHCMTLAICRVSLIVSKLRVRSSSHKRQGATSDERKELFGLCKKLIQQSTSILRNAELVRFSWHLKSIFQFDALVWMLNEIRQPEPVIDIAEAWSQIDELFVCRPETLEQKRSINLALGRLTLKAWEATQARAPTPLSDPWYITTLRANVGQRHASRQISETPGTPYNPFAKADITSDLPGSTQAELDTWTGHMNWSLTDDLNSYTDWAFWDQLIRDQEDGPRPLLRIV